MEILEGSVSEKTINYPQVYWGKRGEEYGLANMLLVLIERDPKIWHNLYPQDSKDCYQKTAQCKELAKILFANIPEINIHLQTRYGLENYGLSVFKRLKYWESSFANALLTMSPSSNWPDQGKIDLLCPGFVRLAPLFWRHMETRKKFANPELSKARGRLQFCTAITVYNPQRAAAQIAFQDSVLRQLKDPPSSSDYSPIPRTSPNQNNASKNRLPEPNVAYYNPLQEPTALFGGKISLATESSYPSQSCEQNSQISQQSPVSDSAVLPDEKLPQHDGRQTRSGFFKPLQYEKAAQQVTSSDLGETPHQLDEFQLQEMEPLLDEGEAQADLVHQLQLEIRGLEGRTSDLERIVIKLVGEKRRCSSEQDQQDKADKEHLDKRHRRYERFDNPNPQTPKKARQSSTEREFYKALRYLNSDGDDTEDVPITSTNSMPPQIDNISVASAGFRQGENREEFRPRHPLPRSKPPPQKITADFHQAEKREEFRPGHSLPHPKPPPPPKITHVFSSQLYAARLREAALLEKQRLSWARPAPPHQDEHEPARQFPSATQTQVQTEAKALGSTYSPHLTGKVVTEAGSREEYREELDKARLRAWREEVETISQIRSDRRIKAREMLRSALLSANESKIRDSIADYIRHTNT